MTALLRKLRSQANPDCPVRCRTFGAFRQTHVKVESIKKGDSWSLLLSFLEPSVGMQKEFLPIPVAVVAFLLF